MQKLWLLYMFHKSDTVFLKMATAVLIDFKCQ